MMEKIHPLSFLGRRTFAPRPLSEATEIFDTDHEQDSEIEDSEIGDSPRSTGSMQSLVNDSDSNPSTPEPLPTPLSAGLGGFEFHFDDVPVEGPIGPHLFRASPEILDSIDGFTSENYPLNMSPVVDKVPQVARLLPSARPFTTLNTAVAELDETQVRSWTPSQVADWMREAGFENSVVEKFLAHDISGVVLLDLQFEDLKELDITSYGKRHRVMSSIQHLRNSSMISESPLSRSSSRAERPRHVLTRSVQPEEAVVLAYKTEKGLKTKSPNTTHRRGRHRTPKGEEDVITPAESVSIVAIEQLLPKPHKCSKGEECRKWQKQQQRLQKLQEEFAAATADATETKRPVSEAEPSVVASSDLLGPGQLPEFSITPDNLNEVLLRDPQENVRRFLNFQHIDAEPPSGPMKQSQALSEQLRHLPKLTIPLDPSELPSPPVTAHKTPVSANRAALMAQLRKDPYHYGGVASPADIFRLATPMSATDVPVTAMPIDPLSRDVSQSVPPEMRYGEAPTPDNDDPVPRSASAQPVSRRRHKQASFTPSIAPVDEVSPPNGVAPPGHRPEPPVLPLKADDVQHAGWMRKKKTTKLLRNEWQDHYFSLKGTQLAMLRDDTGTELPLEYINVDEYAVACSSLASSSKLSAAFKKSVLGSGATSSHGQAFAFSLIPEGDKAKKLFAQNKAHHFSVKSRDDRIDWMRDLMLAKALKRSQASGTEIRIDGNMI